MTIKKEIVQRLRSIIGRKHALIVDDDDNWRKLLVATFEDCGWNVSASDSGEGCLKLLGEGKTYDVIFLDYKMPRMNGMETLHEIRKHNQTVVVIFFSGYPEHFEGKDLAAYAPIEVMGKPTTWIEVEHIIQSLSQ